MFVMFFFRFVGSLIMANLLSSTVLAPVLLSDKSSVSAGLSALVVTSSVFSIVAIAVDRYSAVLSPLHYANTISRRRSLASEYSTIQYHGRFLDSFAPKGVSI